MPRRQIPLVNNEIYHVALRAVGDTVIFNNIDDNYRGIFSLYEFNNKNFIEIRRRRKERKKEKASGSPTPADRDLLVEIMVFSFMPNHIHLLLRQIKDNGITRFMKKLGGGYANYFNKKYNRKGHLFNQFRSVHVGTDEQLRNVFLYIHANAISLIEPGWKEMGVKNSERVIDFLENYKWHSYMDYLGGKNFPSVISKDFLLNAMGGEMGCRELLENWVRYKKESENFAEIILE